MFNGKMKAVTFSFDDGVKQDLRLIEIFDKYGLKCTFNLNSELLGKTGELIYEGKPVSHNKVAPSDVAEVYKNHEVAAHTLTHPNLTTLDDAEIIRQVERDRLNLSELAGYEVVGMAYPCGGVNQNEHVADVIRKNTGVKYSRTIISNYSFDLQPELLRFNPTVYGTSEVEKLNSLADEFIAATPDKPQIYYIWGHAYEFDMRGSWDSFEAFCRRISGREDIFYGTNRDVLLAK